MDLDDMNEFYDIKKFFKNKKIKCYTDEYTFNCEIKYKSIKYKFGTIITFSYKKIDNKFTISLCQFINKTEFDIYDHKKFLNDIKKILLNESNVLYIRLKNKKLLEFNILNLDDNYDTYLTDNKSKDEELLRIISSLDLIFLDFVESFDILYVFYFIMLTMILSDNDPEKFNHLLKMSMK